jgi:peptide/nickel transport system substrate-binding protein
MRPDLTFHNSSPITLSDVVFSLEYARRPDSVWADSYASVASIEADEAANSVVLTLSAPDPFLLEKLSSIGGSGIYPEAVVTECGDQFATTVECSVGSGPYMLVEKSEETQVWERFEEFYQPGYIERVELRTIPDPNTQLLEFEAGNVDWIGSILDVEQANRFKSDPAFADSYIEFAAPDAFWYGFNPTVEPFDDIRVRQAIIQLMDIPQAVRVYGLGTPTTTLIHPSLPGHDPDFVAYSHNVEEAQRLLQEAGVADSLDLDLYVWNIPSFVTMTEAIQQQLMSAGINVELQIVEFGTYISEVRNGTYPFFINLGNIGVPDTAQWLYSSFHTDGPFNTGYSNPEVDALLEEAVAEVDLDQRAELARQANELILQDAIVVPIMNRIGAQVFQPWILREEGADPIYPRVRFNELWIAPDHR